MKNVFFYSVVSLLLSAACNRAAQRQLPYYHTPDFTPHWLSGAQQNNDTLHRIGKFFTTDQEGSAFSDEQMKGRISVVNFFFTSCGSICPRMTKNLQKVQKQFARDASVQLVSFSVTPWIDTTVRLQWYANRFGIDHHSWHLLNGNKAEVYKLAREAFFAEEETGFTKDSSDFLHTEHVLLIDGDLHIRGIYNGTVALDAERLAADISSLLN